MQQLTILDGAMGTMLQARGLGLGERPDIFGMQHPEILKSIHQAYLDAGSTVIYANTFGSNRHKLAGTGADLRAVVSANLAIAREAATGKARVALDVGPIGELLEPLGKLSFEEAYDCYRELVLLGEENGADLVVFETMTDLAEVRAAVLAAKENSRLPVWVTMSFEASGRTFLGTTVQSMALTLDGLGVDAMGINCSLGPTEILPLIREMRTWTRRPLIVKPNAGLPDPATGAYSVTPESFAREMMAYLPLGISILGGCCGTTPEFIRALSQINGAEESAAKTEGSVEAVFTGPVAKEKAGETQNAGTEIPATASETPEIARETPAELPELRQGVCSAGQTVELGGVRVIGERINPTGKKRFQQALREHDLDYIMERAVEQADAGADILDINVGLPGLDEPEMMRDVVRAVQSVVSLPLQIDSTNPAAIEAGLRACCGRAIVNSVNADDEKLQQVLPIVKKYGAAVVGLTMDRNGIPQTAEARFALAEKILRAALAAGLRKEDVFIDCLTLTVSAQQEQARETLKAVRMVRDRLGLHCVLGVSNISFGLPRRIYVTESFLTQAMASGLDLPIVNPNQKEIMDAIASYRVLSGEDAGCGAYIARFAEEEAAIKEAAARSAAGGSAGSTSAGGTVSAACPERASSVTAGVAGSAAGRSAAGVSFEAGSRKSKGMTLADAIYKGLEKETALLTLEALETRTELEVVNECLIPALDIVGEAYEKGRIFLPQLIHAANAACAGFDRVRERIAARGGESVNRGKILLATVEGDIHDIGKNIAKVVLENYGYQVIDLGKDARVQDVVDTAIREDVRLVGLSALMTTTVDSMKRTITALRASGHDCKIMVGGAVLTEDYAREIGADYYVRDAKADADVAKEVLG